MILTGKTTILMLDFHGTMRATRILSARFNRALRRGKEPQIFAPEGRIVPSKGLAWSAVAATIRQGKRVQARVEDS